MQSGQYCLLCDASSNDVRHILLSHCIEWETASGLVEIRGNIEIHNATPLHLVAAIGEKLLSSS
jgi:hypothetical protein